MYHLTALVTCLAILMYFFFSAQVAKARGTYGIKAPAISGNPDFERVFRAHMNTLEWMPIFLPALWLFAIYISDAIAAALGVVWIVGRILYMTGYAKAANKRRSGFAIQASAATILWVGATGAILWRLVHP
jgi:glutathione S-transferase